MAKQKLEKMISKSIKSNDILWGMKLHNNPLAHQNTPADFILSTEYTTYSNHPILALVECKQVTCKEGKGRLGFKRLKQLHDMLSFQNKFTFHKSYFCIAFYDGRWDNSEIYIVPVKEMEDFIHNHSMVSVNRLDMHLKFRQYLCPIKTGSVIDIWSKLK